jgi:citrate synthase
MNYTSEQLTERLSHLAEINDPIDFELYEKFDVKRGLRQLDGRGVLVGLTRIGDVVGYEMRGSEKVAIPGRLLYRGYSIEDIVQDSQANGAFGFEQTAYILLFGELPSASQLSDFREFLGSKRQLPEHFNEDMIMNAPSSDIMNKLARCVLASYSYDAFPEDVHVPNVLRQCIELMARFPTMAAYALQTKRHYYQRKSLHIHIPDPALSTAENFLRLIRANMRYTRAEAEILDLALVLHAEHGGGNNSTFAVHVVTSADTDTYSAIAAAVGSLKGRRHGGANVKIMEMMDEIKAAVRDWQSEKAVGDHLRKILRRKAYDKTGLIYGMGHAVYTISDPRAVLLRDKAEILARERGKSDEFELYRLIEKIAPAIIHEEHSTEKRICFNVDFYSGFVYSLLDIPRDLFTPIFAISRIAGWSAHRIEEIVAGRRIYRPAFKNIGEERVYVPLQDRQP